MSFEITVGEAFANDNGPAVVGALLEEIASKSLVNRLDKVCNKELDRNEFKNVTLVLKAIEHLCESDEEAIQSFIQQATGFLKMEELKSAKDLVILVEEFYDASMSVGRTSVEGKGQIQDVFVLRFGALVIDTNISFSLRLEAIRTINSILDMATKEERKKFSLSEDHCLLLEEFAKVVLNVGDYEMQVAISEALCRMTLKKWREDLVYKWFSNRAFSDSFKQINDKEFETDCRKFLNQVNNYFGDERRVLTFPCVKAFLDLTELFMPDDRCLDKFWIDFNLGTTCISFFVNDPEGTLWESIHLAEEKVCGYNVLVCDDQKILTVHMAVPVTHSKTKGKTIQIIFDSQYDVENALKRVFGEEKQWQSAPSQGRSEPETLPWPSVLVTTEQADVFPVGHRDEPMVAPLQEMAEVYQLSDHSDTEVARAKARLFSQSVSSDGSAKSTPVAGEKPKQSHKIQRSKADDECDDSVTQGETSLRFQQSTLDRSNYTRKKPKTKRLRILPLSSASSAEEPGVVKHSTPAPTLVEEEPQGKRNTEKVFAASKDQFGQFESLDISAIPTLLFQDHDSGFPKNTGFKDPAFLTIGQDETSTKEHDTSKVATSPFARKRKTVFTGPVFGLVPEKRQVVKEPDQPIGGLQPRRLFPVSPLEDTMERTIPTSSKDTESDTEMGSGVIAAFQNFKSQLRAHFSARYKKIESRSLESLSDCQNNVTSLLGAVHSQRLMHLDRFQATVVHELNNLERDCHSLKEIEGETVNFWRTESQSVVLFCDRQERRLQSLELLRKETESSTPKEAVASPSQERTTDGHNNNNMPSAKTPTTT
ncbi:hypothetical protein AAFF_G00355090 [Aldrovandia affinis]|uniref:Synaptonemal complex protein 2-like n=1 Tax=Aldrovandia affinis TaxID=143900 RepID=A0AAD7SIK9_9TELE|nr:hypothetical protein AAFF_G00355090 [Aldrovandia affinis]